MRTFRPPLPADLPPDVRLVVDLVGPVYDVDLAGIDGDPARQAAIRDHVAARVHPDFEVDLTFAAPRGPSRGADALMEAWGEWLSVFSSYRSHLEEVVDAGDGRVGLFGHDTVATREGIEMSIAVGAVYEVRDGAIRGARYFSDQAAARAELA